MRHIFQKTTYPLLEEKIRELNMDMANNYKDNAQDDFTELEKVFEELKAAKKLNERQLDIIIESPMGGAISTDEIAKRVPKGTEAVYVRVDENKIYWVKGKKTGDIDIWE